MYPTTIKPDEKVVVYIPAIVFVNLQQLLEKVPSHDYQEALKLVETRKTLENGLYISLQDFINREFSGNKIKETSLETSTDTPINKKTNQDKK